MRTVKESETYTRKAEVKGQLVSFQHKTLHKASKKHFVLNTSFDFTGVEPSTILRLAGETLLIRWRTVFKDAEQVDERADNQKVKVLDMLKGRKPRMSKGERTEKAIDELSKEEKLAILKRLQKELQEGAAA